MSSVCVLDVSGTYTWVGGDAQNDWSGDPRADNAGHTHHAPQIYIHAASSLPVQFTRTVIGFG